MSYNFDTNAYAAARAVLVAEYQAGRVSINQKSLIYRQVSWDDCQILATLASTRAVGESDTRYPNSSAYQEGDAFRHGYWSALLTDLFGAAAAELFTTTYEDATTNNTGLSREMDIYNNAIGRGLASGKYFTSYEECANLISNAINQGQFKKIVNNALVPTGSGIPEPPAEWSTAKKIQYYLDATGFDTGGVDGIFGVKSSVALILLQYSFGSTYVTGNIDGTSYDLVKSAANTGITYTTTEAYAASHPAGNSSIAKVTLNNGYLGTGSMVRVPTVSYGNAYLEKNTAIAWAIMVDAARKNNKNANSFAALNTTAGYRAYHYQAEAYVYERRGSNPPNASNPYFIKGTTLEYVISNGLRSTDVYANNTYAENWIKNCDFNQNLGWNNVPDSVTAQGGDLFGYGGSNHGWGLAIDMACEGTLEYAWIAVNGPSYGFDPEPEEPWHWNYKRI